MKTLTIKKSKWLRGSPSVLLDDKGKMCCLGFLGKACGATDNQLYEVGSPSGNMNIKWSPLILENYGNSELCRDMIKVNDHPKINLKDRQNKLRTLFKEIGYKLRFVK